jgi:hypothetical protein
LNLANNHSAQLELGWHTVKLRSQEDSNKSKSCGDAEKHEEGFFSAILWNGLAELMLECPKTAQAATGSFVPARAG